MRDLIKITTNDEGKQLVSARELHEKLILEEGKEERFSQWFKRHLQYGFEENIDYVVCKKIYAANQYGGEKELIDYAMTIEMAKEICMLQKSDKGREFRKYFIECEKIAKGEINTNRHISDTDGAKSQIDLLTVTSKLLNLNDSSKLLLATKIYEDYNIPTAYLPTYTDSRGILKSATELLKENNIPISTIKFNKIMIDKGYLIEAERTSGKDKSKIKKFKNLAKTEFGENQISPKNPKETQPMYYENKFLELLKELGIK